MTTLSRLINIMLLVGYFSLAPGVQAATYQLTDGNSQLGVNDRNGVRTWYVDGGMALTKT